MQVQSRLPGKLSSTEGSDKVATAATGARFESTSVSKACQTQTQGSCTGVCRKLVNAVQKVTFGYSRQYFQNFPKRAKETGALSPSGLCWHSWPWQKKPLINPCPQGLGWRPEVISFLYGYLTDLLCIGPTNTRLSIC